MFVEFFFLLVKKYILNFHSSTKTGEDQFVEAIIWWLEQGSPYTPREIATRTALLFAALLKEASTWQ